MRGPVCLSVVLPRLSSRDALTIEMVELTYTRLPDGSNRSFSTGVVKLRLGATEFPVHHDLLYDGSMVYRDAVTSTGGSPCAVLDVPERFSLEHVDFFLCMLYNLPWTGRDDWSPDDLLEFFRFINPSPSVLKVADNELRTHHFFHECEIDGCGMPRVHDVLRVLLALDRDFRTTLPETHASAKTSMQKAALFWGRDFFAVFASRDLLGQLAPETVIDLWHATMWSFVDLETAYSWRHPYTVRSNPEAPREVAAALTAPQLEGQLSAIGAVTIHPAKKPNVLESPLPSMPFRHTFEKIQFSLTVRDLLEVSRTSVRPWLFDVETGVENPTLEVVLENENLTTWFCGEYVNCRGRRVRGRVCPAYMKGRIQTEPEISWWNETLTDWTHRVVLHGHHATTVRFEGDILIMHH